MTRLAELWAHRRWALIGFVAAVALALFFGIRSLSFAIYWNDPAHIRQPVEGWMTPGYVGRSWDIPRDEMIALLGLDPKSARGMTLQHIAAAQGVSLADLIARIEAARP